MKLPKKITPDSLIETIVEIRMKPKCPPELWAGMISNRLQGLGYNFIPSPHVNVRLDKNGKVAVSLGGPVKDNTLSGLFVKGHIRFVMQDNSLSFNCNMGHYVGWASYIEEIKGIVSAVKECGIAEEFDRAQVRYISEYIDADILDHIKGSIDLGGSGNQFNVQELKLNKMEGNIKIFVALSNKAKRKFNNNSEHISSLFDVNVYENFMTSDIDELVALLNNIHNAEKQTFFGLLKGEYLESLNPEYDS